MGTSEHLGLFLDETRDNLRALDVALRDLGRAPEDAGALATVFRVVHSLKGMSAAMGLTAMTDLAHRMEDALAAVRDEGRTATPAVLTMLAGCRDGLARLADAAAEGREPARMTHRRSDALDAIAATSASVRVAADRLDALARSATELAGLVAAARAGDRDALEGMGASVDALAALVASIRLVPVDDVFLRFPGVVRDLSQALGKLVDLESDGGGIAIDRAVADHLAEPLLHALRNAIDHGLEDPCERVAAGKPAVGVVRLSARREGARVVVEVRDDGRGMDPQALRASAVRAGRMDVATALALPDPDALRLVFLPVLSTARAITAISGRGVGMDAVLAAVEALGGDVAVASVPGEGTAITFALPLAQPCGPS